MAEFKVLAFGEESGVLHLEHDDSSVIRLRVPLEVFQGVEVGSSIEVPDDLSSPDAAALGF